MATKTTCDKCGKVLTERERYKLLFQLLGKDDVNYEEYDLCNECKQDILKFVENFIYPKED